MRGLEGIWEKGVGNVGAAEEDLVFVFYGGELAMFETERVWNSDLRLLFRNVEVSGERFY